MKKRIISVLLAGALMVAFAAGCGAQSSQSSEKDASSSAVSTKDSADKAKITCEGGNCTITDGTVTETCTDCIAK